MKREIPKPSMVDVVEHYGGTVVCADRGGWRKSTCILHEDKKIPQSRGCPNGYRIGAIHTFAGGGAPTSYAVLIAVRQYGFEGPDFRWIAVAGRF